MKKLNKILQDEAKNNTPDLYAKIMAEADKENLFTKKNKQISTDKKNSGQRFSVVNFLKLYKKAITSIGAVALVLLVAFCVILPQVNFRAEDDKKLSPIELSVNDFYGVGAVSTVKLLNNVDSGISLQSNEINSNNQNYKEYIKDFNKYFSSIDCFLGNSFISTTAVSNDNVNYSQYSYKLNVATTDLLNNKNDFVLYYNESQSIETDDIKESNFILDGIMVYNGQEHRLLGERSASSGSQEMEEELRIRAFLNDTPNSYVEMEQEISNEQGEREIEYVYRVYSDNQLIEETAIEFEKGTVNNENKTEFSLYYRVGNEVGFYKTHHQEQDNVIYVEYEINGEKGEFVVTVQINEKGKKCYDYKLPNEEIIAVFK